MYTLGVKSNLRNSTYNICLIRNSEGLGGRSINIDINVSNLGGIGWW